MVTLQGDHFTPRVGLEGLPGLQDERIPLMVWQSCGFTVHSIVVSAMEEGKPIFGALSSRQHDCLSAFIRLLLLTLLYTEVYFYFYLYCYFRFCGVVGSNFGEPKVIRSHSLVLLSTLLEEDATNPSILNLDIFSLLVSLTYSLPSLFNGEGPAPLPSCNIQDLHLLRLAYTAHLTQLLASLSPSTQARQGFRTPPAKECAPLLDLLQVGWRKLLVLLLSPLGSERRPRGALPGPVPPVAGLCPRLPPLPPLRRPLLPLPQWSGGP